MQEPDGTGGGNNRPAPAGGPRALLAREEPQLSLARHKTRVPKFNQAIIACGMISFWPNHEDISVSVPVSEERLHGWTGDRVHTSR